MLHIVIDVRRIADFGIGTYIRNLVRGLARVDQGNRYTLVARPEDVPSFPVPGPNFTVAAYARPETQLVHNFTFPRFLRSLNADLCHIPLNTVAWWMPRPYVVTVHDMSSLLYPTRRDLRQKLHIAQYRRGARRASRVITVSQTTRRDLEKVARIPAERLCTIYSAPDPAFTVEDGDSTHDRMLLDRYSIHYPFILYAGTIRPQKNISRLIEAFAVVRADLELNPSFADLRLIIIGDELSKNPSVRRAVAEARMQPFVRFLGFVPATTLRVFYRAASVFAFPSLYEGFGLAPLEAMACGTPVVASNIPALVEAVAGAAELVNPRRVFEIARGLRSLLVDEARRERLKTAGREQARRFHWDATAREVLRVYLETPRD
ncbi:MAG: glycosyltransferase family 4 protein [Bryobacteraceae bacterium]